MSDDTVYVLDAAAVPANQVMMVVSDTRLKERGGVRGFNAPYQSDLHKSMEIVINGLQRKSAEALPCGDAYVFGVEMPTAMNRRENRETGSRNPHPHRPQPFLEHFRACLHGFTIALNLEYVKKRIVSGKGIQTSDRRYIMRLLRDM